MIRPATVDDIPAIREMAEVVFRKTYRDILSPEQMEYMMDMMYSERSLVHQMTTERQKFFIDPGRGYVSFRSDGMTEEGQDRFHLEKLYVMPDARNTGLGKKLFRMVCDYVIKISTGHPRLELNVNRYSSAVSFYEHLGMRRDRSGDFPIGRGFFMNDYIMAIDL